MEKEREDCPLEFTLEIISGKWKAQILWHLLHGTLRYSALMRSIPGITEKVLIQQLRQLEGDGIIERHEYEEMPPRVEYDFTEKGQSLCTAVQALCDWGRIEMNKTVAVI